MFEGLVIPNVSLAILALLPFLVSGAAIAVKAFLKARAVAYQAWMGQSLAAVFSFGAVFGSFYLSGSPLPADASAWMFWLASMFGAQMVAYEIILKRVLSLFGL